jgi:hypothetical protein
MGRLTYACFDLFAHITLMTCLIGGRVCVCVFAMCWAARGRWRACVCVRPFHSA